MKTLITALLIISSLAVSAKRERPKRKLLLNDFTTDGCSAYPDGYPHTEEYEWLHCCFAHDISYWVGGTQEEKAAADEELNRCVSQATFGAHGKMMELGVATGGTPHIATSWRWGYGWNQSVSYNDLSSKKLEMIGNKAYTILNALVLESFYLNDEQIDYATEMFTQFRERMTQKAQEIEAP